MKRIKFLMCLLLLSSGSNFSFACSYYPTGEDIRFSLFLSSISDNMDMEPLFYSTHFFNEYSQRELNGPDENLDAWFQYFEGKIKRSAIDELIYQIPFEKPDDRLVKNELYSYFKEGKDTETSDYILFAKKVEYLLKDDYWTQKTMDVESSIVALNYANRKCRSIQNKHLRLRYGYQTMVLAYYLDEYGIGLNVYDEVIAPLNSSNVIATWCLFHKANMIEDYYEKMRLFAIVFEKSRSKNRYIFSRFPTEKEKVDKILEHCQNDEEKAAVNCILAFKNPARAMDQIQTILALNPKTSLLDVLLVREINKMEDWYYTDRYTGYGAGIQSAWWGDEKEDFAFFDWKNFESDKLYLKRVYKEVSQISNDSNIPNKSLWYISLGYMAYMLDQEVAVASNLSKANNLSPTRVQIAQMKTIELLSLVKFESDWESKEFQDKLYSGINELSACKKEIYNYDRFEGQIMLAVSRKYLEDGNVVLAALFEGKVVGGTHEQYTDWWAEEYQTFDLLNENGNSQTMDAFFALWNKEDKTALETYLFSSLEPWRWRFTDLWGTTYLREDQLDRALEIYEMIPDSVWEVTNSEFHYYYAQELDSNPFETRFSRSNTSDDRSISYTKPEFVREVIRLKKEAETNEKNRAYNYMLLGNAYYNMSFEGNSWYYTEYALSQSDWNTPVKKDPYPIWKLAGEYYQLAENVSQSERFSAFCYRLRYKCLYLDNTEGIDVNWDNYKAEKKSYDSRFKMRYPKHFESLQGCDRFHYYLDSWKNA